MPAPEEPTEADAGVAVPDGGGAGGAGVSASGVLDGGHSALPPVAARLIAFIAILVAGACGGLIGRALVEVQCRGDCSTPTAIGTLIGSVTAAAGVAVVAVLVLRAMGEWQAGLRRHDR